MSFRLIVTIGFALLLFAVPYRAQANGQRDLDAGIAFYDSLDLERARTYLVAATEATDLSPSALASAFLYIGMLEYELGQKAQAEVAWASAFALAPNTAAPEGTSPKTISAMHAVRIRKGDVPKAIDPLPPVHTSTAVPNLRGPSAGTHPALVPPQAEKEDYGSIPVWVGVTAAVVVAAVLLGAVLGGGDDSGCARASGAGCLNVTVR